MTCANTLQENHVFRCSAQIVAVEVRLMQQGAAGAEMKPRHAHVPTRQNMAIMISGRAVDVFEACTTRHITCIVSILTWGANQRLRLL